MPLQSGDSRAAFEHNLKAELEAGKPRDQALAIAYAKQRGDGAESSFNEAFSTFNAAFIRDRAAKLDAALARCVKLGSS
ncbi:MAG TPA: hypothetical protein VHB99_12315 [Pirellulales bacterium]|nr:hypothetical protein [Pirellulales bacterium]